MSTHQPTALHTVTESSQPSRQRQRGQATTEYALILLVAAVVAIGVIAWATAGGGAGKIGSLFDSVLDSVLSRAESTF